MQDIESRIKDILTCVLDEEVTIETSVNTSNQWDSLNFLKIVAELEKAFQICFSSEEIMELNSFEGILWIINHKQQTET